MKKIITLTLIMVVFASCKSKAPLIGDPNASFEIVKQETIGGHDKPGFNVIRNQEDLNKLYAELNSTDDIPAPDFSQNNIIALYMGQKRTGGYSITITSVDISENTAYIHKAENAPQDMATMMITSPYCIAIIPKTEKVEVQ